MNTKMLHKRLLQLTANEMKYKNNIQDFSDIPFSTRKIDKADVLYIPIKDTVVFKSGPLFSIKKHSRFQDFPSHCHDGIEINYMYSGNCHQIINNKEYILTKGQILFLNSNTIHKILPLGIDDILLNININTDYLISNFLNHFSCDSILTRFFINSLTDSIRQDTFLFFQSEKNENLHYYLSNLLCEWYSPSIVTQDIMENLLSLIMCELVIVYKNNYTNKINPLESTQILPILRYIEENYQICSLTQTASFFNLNANYLSNLLKKHTGFTYLELVQQKKLSVSEQLLISSNLSVSEIAHLVGYENINFFYKKFKQKNSCSPNDYRKDKKNRNGHSLS